MARWVRPAQLLWRLWYRARLPLFATPAYRRRLGGEAAEPPRAFVPSLWPGDAEAGRLILNGRIRLLGVEAPLGEPLDWHPAGMAPLWRFTLHYFEWLADLLATGEAGAAARARALVAAWWRVHGDTVAGEAWHPYPLSLRLVAWLRAAPVLLDGAEPGFARMFAAALDVQARHLAAVPERDVGGNHLVKNLKALAASGSCLPGHRCRLAPALAALRRQLARQVLADGCHYERSPAYHLQVLCDLVDLRALLGGSCPDWLAAAIGRMAAALAALRHGDGLLAQFNDGDEGDPALLAALDRLVPPPSPAPDLPAAGYFRLEREGMVVLVDSGRCCPDVLPAHAHADTLSVELSDGPERLVVNSGTYAYQDPLWRNRLRGTAAASTLMVDDLDSAEVFGVFRLGRRPRRVMAEREGWEVSACHDGYRHLGVVHRRTVSLGPDGLVGEDVVEGAAGRRLTARFHLHPDVSAELDGDAARLVTACGHVWRFSCAGGRLALADGAYSPRFGVLRAGRVLVAEIGLAQPVSRLTWRFRREG
jgi:uncharacterized heparinase superfamily protein